MNTEDVSGPGKMLAVTVKSLFNIDLLKFGKSLGKKYPAIQHFADKIFQSISH